MKSYTVLRNLAGSLVNTSDSTTLTLLDQLIDDGHRLILGSRDWPFLHRLRTATTIASTTFVALPYDVDLVENVFVTVSSTRHNPRPAPNRKFWDDLHYSSVNSDIPEYWFVYNGQLGLWPTPSSSGNTISIDCKVRVIDINVADYTAGTIKTVVNDDETIVGGSTVWTSQMAGRWLRVTHSDTADTGDGLWYEISSITDGTNLELVRKYGGTAITAGTAAYALGMMPLLPEAFHNMPVFYAVAEYWDMQNDITRATQYRNKYDLSMKELNKNYSITDLSMVVDRGYDEDFIVNPNLTIQL